MSSNNLNISKSSNIALSILCAVILLNIWDAYNPMSNI